MEHLTSETDPIDQMSIDNSHDWTTIFCASCGLEYKIRKTCSFRFCQFCSQARASRIRRRLRYILDTYPPPAGHTLKMITVSVKNTADLQDGIKHLIASFRRLRQTKDWKFHVSGGATIVEITGKKGDFHPHLHVLCYSRFYPFKRLLNQWKRCSGGSACYIQAIPKDKGMAYVTKYVTKFDGKLSDQHEVSDSLKGYRLFQRFGEWHHFVIPRLRFDVACPVCHAICWLTSWEIEREMRSFRSG